MARRGTKAQHGKTSRYPHSPNSNETSLGPASHAGPVVTVRGQTTKQVLLGNVAIKTPRVTSQYFCASIPTLVLPTPCPPTTSLIEIARHPCPTRVGLLIDSLCHPHGWLFFVTTLRERAPAVLTWSINSVGIDILHAYTPGAPRVSVIRYGGAFSFVPIRPTCEQIGIHELHNFHHR